MLSSSPSLYKSIDASAKSASSYVSKTEGDDTSTHLFDASSYSDDNDVFYGYKNGTSLDYKNSFVSTYFSDAASIKQVSFLHYDASSSSTASFHGSYSYYINNSDAYKTAGTLNLWESNHNIDSYASLMVPTYSGITKESYAISLSKAEITPPYDGTDSTYAFVGFSVSDDNYLESQGLACNTNTGDWYLYNGLARQPLVNIELGGIVMQSTYDETTGIFTPKEDIMMTEETLKETSESGSVSYLHRFSVTTSLGRTYVNDFRYSVNTMAATINFVAGLDITNGGKSVLDHVPDFMNGSSFNNLVVTSATGTVLSTTRNNNYGQVMLISKGDYNLLCAGGLSKGMRQGVLNNDSFATFAIDSSTDVYSFSYDVAEGPSKAKEITDIEALIELLPENASDVTSDDTAKIYRAKKAYDALVTDGQKNMVSNSKRLLDDYNALE